jgi:hypothetical protein
MNRKRVEFFMEKEDEIAFMAKVFSYPDVSLIRSQWYEKPEYEEYIDLDTFMKQPIMDSFQNRPDWFIWFKDFSHEELKYIKDGPIPELINQKTDHDEIIRQVKIELGLIEGELIEYPEGNYYSFGHLSNPLICYDRCYKEGDMLMLGELIYGEKIFDAEGNIYEFDKQLTKRYDSIARWIRKNGVKATWDGSRIVANIYILPGALKYFYNGGKLSSPSLGFGRSKDRSLKPLGYGKEKESTD